MSNTPAKSIKEHGERAQKCVGDDLKKGEQRIFMFPAYHVRKDPDNGKDYGRHGIEINFVKRYGANAISISFYTDYHIEPHPSFDGMTPKEMLCAGMYFHYRHKKDASDYAYKRDECPFTGGKCYGEAGSALYGETISKRLLYDGSAGVWDEMDMAAKEEGWIE